MSDPTSLQLEAACLQCLVSNTNFEGGVQYTQEESLRESELKKGKVGMKDFFKISAQYIFASSQRCFFSKGLVNW